MLHYKRNRNSFLVANLHILFSYHSFHKNIFLEFLKLNKKKIKYVVFPNSWTRSICGGIYVFYREPSISCAELSNHELSLITDKTW